MQKLTANTKYKKYKNCENKSKDIPSQIKMIYCMVKISCISHFIDNLHAFANRSEMEKEEAMGESA